MTTNVRKLSLDILYDVNENNEFCDVAIHKVMDEMTAADSRDRAFLLALTEGTLERRIELDYLIDQYSSRPVAKLKPYVRNILRMAVYQLRYMEQVPDSAAVNEAVKLTVACGYSGLKGFVNGILRNMTRTLSQVRYPDRVKSPINYLSVKYSMPVWLVEHFIDELGVKAAAGVMGYFLDDPDTVIRYSGEAGRLDEFKEELLKGGIEYEESKIFVYALRLKRPGKISGIPGYGEGSFAVQDISSMIPAHIAATYAKEAYLGDGSRVLNVLDMCAAPGGKALHLAGELGSNVHIEARDISQAKIRKISDNARRLGINSISVKVSDAGILDQSCTDVYDMVIADLPCSGLGVIGKKPDIKYNASEKGMAELASLQLRMLDNAANYAVRGGIIIFSTCTINRGENEQNALAFLEEHTDYTQVNVGSFLPDSLQCCTTEDGFVKVIPGDVKADGFFVAVFRRSVNERNKNGM